MKPRNKKLVLLADISNIDRHQYNFGYRKSIGQKIGKIIKKYRACRASSHGLDFVNLTAQIRSFYDLTNQTSSTFLKASNSYNFYQMVDFKYET